MTAKDIINYNKLSEHYGYQGNNIRKNISPKKRELAIKELEDLVDYWLRERSFLEYKEKK